MSTLADLLPPINGNQFLTWVCCLFVVLSVAKLARDWRSGDKRLKVEGRMHTREEETVVTMTMLAAQLVSCASKEELRSMERRIESKSEENFRALEAKRSENTKDLHAKLDEMKDDLSADISGSREQIAGLKASTDYQGKRMESIEGKLENILGRLGGRQSQ